MSKRVHIVVAEPSAIVRCGLVTLLQQAEGLSVDIAELSDVSTIATASYRHLPDLLIVNPSYLGHFSPSSLRSSIGNESLKIVALQSAFVEQGLLQSYDATLSIYDTIDTIVERLKDVISADQDDRRDDLSSREREIIVSVVRGLTNKQIADELCLSVHTVIAHRRNIATKLQIHSPSGLTIYAIVNRLVDLSEVRKSISQI